MFRLSAVFILTLALLPLQAADTALPDAPNPKHVWGEDFSHPQAPDEDGMILPEHWKVEGLKFRVPATVCSIAPGTDGKKVLRVTCDKSTGGIICDPEIISQIDLKKTPILRWRWRILTYPKGADARDPEKDDQPLAIYIGVDGSFIKRSLAYRWEGLTPVKFEGTAKYGGGLVQVHYIVLRNQKTPAGEWVTETRNLAEDFRRIYGEIPQRFTISIMANSQYTQSNTAAEIAFIEFLPAE